MYNLPQIHGWIIILFAVKFKCMRKTGIIALAVLLAAMLVSCDLLPSLNWNPDNMDTLEENSFYAQNMTNKKYYKVKAEMMWVGTYCVIWAEKGSGISQNNAKDIAVKYDTVIRPRVVDAFSNRNFSIRENGTDYYFSDMLDYANFQAGRDDRKLTILLLDIKDGFKNPGTDSYVAGYFFSGNFEPQGKINGSIHYSNHRDMIYVDTDPGLKTELEQTYATLAHELQHLINYITSVQMNRGNAMDTWIDEGLSSQAEYLYLEKNPKDKCEWFSNDREGTIARGNNFFVWDNHSEPLAILDEYATVYLFFRWLYLQADNDLQSHIFRDIATSNYYDYRAVTNVAQMINPAWYDWEILLGTWLAANYYPRNAEYGYKDDNYLQNGDGRNFHGINVNPISGTSISLYPGEGVYSVIDNSFSPGTGSANIRYAGLSDSDGIDMSAPYTGNTLLTFNASTVVNNRTNPPKADTETGYLTGLPPSSAAPRSAAGNARTGITGPYRIDARDLLGRDWQ